MKNYRLTIEYDGSGYHGWQFQKNALTIQEVIEEALFQIARKRVRLNSSGRTDTGVHALNQVVNFKADLEIKTSRLLIGLNGLLPDDIVVKGIDEMPDNFDARRSAKSKTYRYVILNRKTPSALKRFRCWHVRDPLDLETMKKGAEILIGEHDFSSFRASGCSAKHAVREILRTSFTVKENGFIVFEIEGRAFLRHMVRNIVGTLVALGLGKINLAEFEAIIDARDRTRGGVAAPARGLFLVEVNY